ncbi:MAG: hypothetical protein ACF8XB_04240 [Planctomycetota bacterium JB042]
MTPISALLLSIALQHHHHDERFEVTGDGPPVLAARTVSRHGPFGHLALLNERLEVAALAEVGRVVGWAVRPAGGEEVRPRVAVLEAAGRGAATLRLLDGRTLARASRPVLLEGVARPDGPLGPRGTVRFAGERGERLLVLGDPAAAPDERGEPTLWAHAFALDGLEPGDPPRSRDGVVFPAPEPGPFSLVAALDRPLAAFVGGSTVTCVDLESGGGESFSLPAADAPIRDVALRSDAPRLVVERSGAADELDPRTGDWRRLEPGGEEAEREDVERRVDLASGRVVTWSRRTGEIELVDGPSPPRALPESLKGLAWIASPPPFPASWVGRWSGPLEITRPGSPRPRVVDMALEIAATDDPARWEFTIEYDDGCAPSRRAYTLVAVDPARGRYLVDERNGVEVESWFGADTLTQSYAVGGSRLVMRWRRHGDRMTFDVIVSSDDEGGRDTGGGDVPIVRSFPVTSTQRAELRR